MELQGIRFLLRLHNCLVADCCAGGPGITNWLSSSCLQQYTSQAWLAVPWHALVVDDGLGARQPLLRSQALPDM